MLQQSLRAQILVLLGGSLAALLLQLLACFGSLTATYAPTASCSAPCGRRN